MAGDIYLDTTTHANITAVLQALTALATCSVDLSSLSVQGEDAVPMGDGAGGCSCSPSSPPASPGTRLQLQVYPLSFLVTNWHFSKELLDPLTAEHWELRRALGNVVGGEAAGSSSVLEEGLCFGVALQTSYHLLDWACMGEMSSSCLGLESDGVLSKTFLLGGKSPEGQWELPASGDKRIPVSERAGEEGTRLGRSCGQTLHPKEH